MKDSELIIEQAQAKEKLARLVDYINSNEYHSLSVNKRKAMLNRKVCLEMYLSTLNTEVFEDVDNIIVPDMGWMGVMGYMLSGSIGFGSKFALPDMKAGEVKDES